MEESEEGEEEAPFHYHRSQQRKESLWEEFEVEVEEEGRHRRHLSQPLMFHLQLMSPVDVLEAFDSEQEEDQREREMEVVIEIVMSEAVMEVAMTIRTGETWLTELIVWMVEIIVGDVDFDTNIVVVAADGDIQNFHLLMVLRRTMALFVAVVVG